VRKKSAKQSEEVANCGTACNTTGCGESDCRFFFPGPDEADLAGLPQPICWHDGSFYESRKYPGLDILDRVGGGDSFASGLSFGFLEHNDAQLAVDYGAAHGALASTTPGDTSMATRKEVEKLMKGGSARVVRQASPKLQKSGINNQQSEFPVTRKFNP
jgi:hypothetical protein